MDNLKLGYGGTRKEMERLLEDAGKLAHTKFDISNYGDVIQAIHTIQESLDITGTTAKEASETIEGSMNSTKAAIDNLIVGFARSDADIDKLIEDVDKNIRNVAENAIPVAERAFVALIKTAISAGMELSKEIPRIFEQVTADVHKMIAESFGDDAQKIYAVEAALKAAAAAFVTFKAAAYVADVVDGIKKVNAALKTGVTLQEAMNKAEMANPYVLVATAAIAAATALKSFIDVQTDLIVEGVDGYDLLNDKQKEMVDGIREASKTISESRAKWQETTEILKTNSTLYQKLTDELYRLDEQESLSNKDKERMKIIVDQLNDGIQGLNIQLDKENGHLKTQKSSIDAVIASYKRQAEAEAYYERLKEVTKEQIKNEENLKKAEKERTEARAEYGQLIWKIYQEDSEYQKLQAKGEENLTAAEKERMAYLDSIANEETSRASALKESFGDLDAAFVTASGNVRDGQEAIDEYTNRLVELGEKSTVTAKDLEENSEKVEEAVTRTMGIFSDEDTGITTVFAQVKNQLHEFSEAQITEVAKTIDAYDEMYNAQYQAIAKSVDLYKGFEADTSTTFDDLYNNLQQSSYYLNDWTTAIDQLQAKVDKGLMSQEFLDSLKSMGMDSWNIVYDMNHATETQLQEYSTLWTETNSKIKESTDTLMEKQKKTVETELENITGISGAKISNYRHSMELLGIAGPEGFEKGFEEKLKDIKKTSEETAQAAQDTWAETDETNSPSKKYMKLGEYAVQGFAKGMIDNAGFAEDAAQYVATEAYNAMVDTLRIGSPSKAMRELGNFTGEGFALGIADEKNDVLNASNMLAESAITPMDRLTPIVTKGGANGAYGGAQSVTEGERQYVFNLVTPDGNIIGRWIAPFVDAVQGQMAAFNTEGYAAW